MRRESPRLNALQWLWVAACLLMFAATLADIAGLVAVPSVVWLLGYAGLALAGRFVMPSLAELKQTNRAGRR
jgi:hypothetical protein